MQSNILDYFREYHPQVCETVLVHPEGYILTGENIVEMVLGVLRSNPEKVVSTVDFYEAYPSYYRFECTDIYPWFGMKVQLIRDIIHKLGRAGFISKYVEGAAGGCYNSESDLLDRHIGGYLLVERRLNPKEASQACNPVTLVTMLWSLSDDAIDDILRYSVVRANLEGSSLYSNAYNTTEEYRLSNHWGTNDSNRLNINYNHEPITGFWVLAKWNAATKEFDFEKTYPDVSRTSEEKIKIIDRLINELYSSNSMAIAQLNALKKSMQKAEKNVDR